VRDDLEGGTEIEGGRVKKLTGVSTTEPAFVLQGSGEGSEPNRVTAYGHRAVRFTASGKCAIGGRDVRKSRGPDGSHPL